MATATVRPPIVAGASRMGRLYGLVRQAPLMPLGVLLVLGLVAVFAPVLAPYEKLAPVQVTAEQCQARYGLVRGEVLSLRERDFVRLAEVNGVSTCDIIRRHLLPNVMNTVMVFFTLIVGVAITIEANLSFLGVGVPPPEPAWGLMISQERDALIEGKWWLAVWPGLCIMLLVLSANMAGDWLRVRLDPQLRNR